MTELTPHQSAVLEELRKHDEGRTSMELAPIARTFGIQSGAGEWANPKLKKLAEKGLVVRTDERRKAARVWKVANS